MAIRNQAGVKLIHSYVGNPSGEYYKYEELLDDDSSISLKWECTQSDSMTGGTYKAMLFDLAQDPYETNDLYDDDAYADIKAELYTQAEAAYTGHMFCPGDGAAKSNKEQRKVWKAAGDYIIPWAEADDAAGFPTFCASLEHSLAPVYDPPSPKPTKKPTAEPSLKPTKPPSDSPTKKPTRTPTDTPTRAPTDVPTTKPTKGPTQAPSTIEPTSEPTTLAPTLAPTPTDEAPSLRHTSPPTPSFMLAQPSPLPSFQAVVLTSPPSPSSMLSSPPSPSLLFNPPSTELSSPPSPSALFNPPQAPSVIDVDGPVDAPTQPEPEQEPAVVQVDLANDSPTLAPSSRFDTFLSEEESM